jgi:tRNA pseudouridine38-40 synthase
MNRFFLDVSYIGTAYAGFQIQKNAVTVQFEVEKALQVLLRKKIVLTGSSRTDAGVHALQNYFHFDTDEIKNTDLIYNINSILPADIAVNKLVPMTPENHCRFDAIRRHYAYYIYQKKNPFLNDRAYYYPYVLNVDQLQHAADILLTHKDFTAFSKRRTQVQSYECTIYESKWIQENEQLIYYVKGNRFLRGMVRGFVGTMLQVGRGKMKLRNFEKIIEDKESSRVDFSVPAKGLFLRAVDFPEKYFD